MSGPLDVAGHLTPPAGVPGQYPSIPGRRGNLLLLDHGGQAVGEVGGGPAGVGQAAGAGGQVVADRAGGHPPQVEGDRRQPALQAGPEQVGGDQLVAGRPGQGPVGQLGARPTPSAASSMVYRVLGDVPGHRLAGLGAAPRSPSERLGAADGGHDQLVPGVGPLLLDQGGPEPVGLAGQPVEALGRRRFGLAGADPGRHGQQGAAERGRGDRRGAAPTGVTVGAA